MKPLLFTLPLLSLGVWAQSPNLDLMNQLIQSERHGRVLTSFSKPQKMTSISVQYAFKEMQLAPNDVVYFYIPEEYSKYKLSQLGLAHRQDGQPLAPLERDPNPGLTSAMIYTKDIPGDEFRYWGGHTSGELGAKFAEIRKAPEMDSLFEWPLKGHFGLKPVKSRRKPKPDTRPISPHAVRVENVGNDNVLLSGLYVEILPPKADEYDMTVFSPKSDFGDPETMKGRVYGGGQKYKGLFPGALGLNNDGHTISSAIPAHFKVKKNKLTINLPPGKKFSTVEIMCGDTHPDQLYPNKDKGWGTLGNGKITVSIENSKTRTRRILLADKNVGPEGVITASDINSNTVLQDGDQLIVTNDKKSSTVYIMALRIGLNQ